MFEFSPGFGEICIPQYLVFFVVFWSSMFELSPGFSEVVFLNI
jgi:hypothetical protein